MTDSRNLFCICGSFICRHQDVCFYQQGHNAWHLIAKPEYRSLFERSLDIKPHPNPNRYNPHKIYCKSCGGDVGNESCIGPADLPLFCFQFKKTRLSQQVTTSNVKWSMARHLYPHVEERLQISTTNYPYSIPPIPLASNGKALKVPSDRDLEQTDMYDLVLNSKFPRNYQIELFVRSMKGNSVIFLPTGSGKTLIAVMALKRMKQINGDKVGILLADRVPLIHQQTKVLEEGGLRVKDFTGENSSQFRASTSDQIQSLIKQNDVLAFTAQVFLNKLSEGFSLSHCSLLVFDEAHHAQKDHPFCSLMRDFYALCPAGFRPQILGLTASPAGKSTLERTSIQLDKLSAMYSHASIHMPVIYKAEMENITNRAYTEGLLVDRNPEEILFLDELAVYVSTLFSRMTQMACALSITVKEFKEIDPADGSVKGEFRKVLDSAQRLSCDDLLLLCEHGLEIINACSKSSVIGPRILRQNLFGYYKRLEDSEKKDPHCRKKLTIMRTFKYPWVSNPAASGSWSSYVPEPDSSDLTKYSSRVQVLIKKIREVMKGNSNPRILVFAQRRSTAKALVRLFEEVRDMAALRPGLLVGHSGLDGMSWDEEQKPTLQRFRTGVIHLLVATSVAEEGLDVPACNAVIRFDGGISMTSVVQSRGRARQRGSKFVLLMDSNEKRQWDMILMEETNMLIEVGMRQNVISERMVMIVNSLIDQLSKNKREFLEGERKGEAEGSMEGEFVEKDAGRREKGISFVVLIHNLPSSAKQKDVAKIFAGYCQVAKCDLKCGKKMNRGIVHLRTHDDQSPHDCFTNICQNAYIAIRKHSIWLQFLSVDPSSLSPSPSSPSPSRSPLLSPSKDNPVSEIVVSRLTLGYLPKSDMFFAVYDVAKDAFNSIKDSDLMLTWNTEKNVFYFSCFENRIQMELFSSSMNDWVLIQNKCKEREHSYHDVDDGDGKREDHVFYFKVKHPPNLYAQSVDNEMVEKWIRISSPYPSHPSHLGSAISSFFYYRVEISSSSSHAFTCLCDAFACNGMNLLHGRVNDHPWTSNASSSNAMKVVRASNAMEEEDVHGDDEEEYRGEDVMDLDGSVFLKRKGNPSVRLKDKKGAGVVKGNGVKEDEDDTEDEDEVEYVEDDEDFVDEEDEDEDEDDIETKDEENFSHSENKKQRESKSRPAKTESERHKSSSSIPSVSPSPSSYQRNYFPSSPINSLGDVSFIKHELSKEEAKLSFSVRYLLECLRSQSLHLLPSPFLPLLFLITLQRMSEKQAQWSLLLLPSILHPFSNLTLALQHPYLRTIPFWGPSLLPIPQNHVAVAFATVTPTRVIYHPPKPVPLNYVLRNYPKPLSQDDKYDAGNYMIIRFRDENGKMINGKEMKLFDRVRQVLESGLDVAGVWFGFLAASASQVRNHSCWFASFNNEKVWKWIGDLSQINSVSKFMTRLGMLFSSSEPSLTLIRGETHSQSIHADIVRNNFCFNDGCGKISLSFLRKIILHSMLDSHPNFSFLPSSPTPRSLPLPSAIQIRVGGCKGVLTLDPSLSKESTVQISSSMFKFPSQHTQIQILSVSKKQEVYLNRQVIMLLSSLGVEDDVFEGLQEEELRSLLSLFHDHTYAWKMLQQEMQDASSSSFSFSSLRSSGFDIMIEPYLKSLLSSLYHFKVRNLTEKSRILVPEGCFLMGVADFTDTLNEGEIFVQLMEDEYVSTEEKNTIHGDDDEDGYAFHAQSRILDCLCLVYRNPCLHPGDISVLKARNDAKVRKNLSHLKNVIVFSVKGDRPEVDKMSGGDLDGDRYSLIWRKDLIPPMSFPPMDYSPPEPSKLPQTKFKKPYQTKHLAQAYVTTMSNSSLGIIANTWLALADEKKEKALHPDCLKLASYHSEAVDAAKTGLVVKIPASLFPSHYPDYMQKQDKPIRISETVIGRMFRRVKCIDEDNVESEADSLVWIEPVFADHKPRFQKHLPKAGVLYGQYCLSLRALMSSYGVESEGEVATGLVTKCYPNLDRSNVGEEVKAQFSSLQRNYRDIFDCLDEKEKEEEEEEGEKVSNQWNVEYMRAMAWYYVAYSDPDPEHRCLSFGWVVGDLLTAVKGQTSNDVSEKRPNASKKFKKQPDSADVAGSSSVSLEERLTESIRVDFLKSKPHLFESFLQRHELFEQLETLIKAYEEGKFSIFMFGSSSTFLFDPDSSDVDFCFLENSNPCPPFHKDPSLLKRYQVEILSHLRDFLLQDFPDLSLIQDTRVPILRSESYSNSSKQPFDISASINGMKKGILLRAYLHGYPSLLLLLRAVLRWGRLCRIISKNGLFTADGMSWMFLSFCAEKGWIGPILPSHMLPLQMREQESGKILEFWVHILDELSSDESNLLNLNLNSNRLHAPSLLDSTRAGLEDSIGKILLDFFQSLSDIRLNRIPGSSPSHPLCIPDPIDPSRFCVQLDTNSLQILQDNSVKAHHILSQTSGISFLTKAVTRHLKIRLGRTITNLIRGSEAYHAQRLSLLVNNRASVKIVPVTNPRRSVRYTFIPLCAEIQGEGHAVQCIERQLYSLDDNSAVYLRATRSRFVPGSVSILFEGSLSESDVVGFRPYLGMHHAQHQSCRLHTASLVGEVRGELWKAHAFAKFKNSVLKQRQLLMQCKNFDELGKFQVVVRFGTLYFINLPRAYEGESLERLNVVDLEQAVIKGKSHSRPWDGESSKDEDMDDEDAEEEGERMGRTKESKGEGEKEEEENNGTLKMHELPLQPSNTKTKTKNKEKNVALSIFLHVTTPEYRLKEYLSSHGYSKVEEKEKYKVMFASCAREARVSLDEKFRVFHVSSKAIRWLASSLTFSEASRDSMAPSAYISESTLHNGPLTARIYIITEKDMTGSKLHTKLKAQPILVRDGPREITISGKFSGDVGHVRHVKSEVWMNRDRSISIEIADVKEWSVWDRRQKCFKCVREKVEVEVGMCKPEVLVRGSILQCKRFIQSLWDITVEIGNLVL